MHQKSRSDERLFLLHAASPDAGTMAAIIIR